MTKQRRAEQIQPNFANCTSYTQTRTQQTTTMEQTNIINESSRCQRPPRTPSLDSFYENQHGDGNGNGSEKEKIKNNCGQHISSLRFRRSLFVLSVLAPSKPLFFLVCSLETFSLCYLPFIFFVFSCVTSVFAASNVSFLAFTGDRNGRLKLTLSSIQEENRKQPSNISVVLLLWCCTRSVMTDCAYFLQKRLE